ncbi:DUF4041 domain-containing protein [Bacillus mobilis]|uniref:DUF4041 domain-containing protein n=1 Tax=Bacillus mobilis TaxID=2026190 RepID=UPI003CF2A70D
MNQKWYLSTWIIAVCFTFSILIIPFIVGVILLIKQSQENKKNKVQWENSGFGDAISLREQKEKLAHDIEKQEADIHKQLQKKLSIQEEITAIEKQKEEAKAELIEFQDEVLLQSFGFYEPKYDFTTSEQYKVRLDQIRKQQKEMVKNKVATFHSETWTVDGSKSKGNALNNSNIKITLNSFNNECDFAVSKVTFNNMESMEKRIHRAFDNLNKANKHNKIEIRYEYLNLKLEELHLAYEFAQKKEEEKEEQRRIKEQMREEERVKREIEKEKQKIEKEEKHFKQEIQNLQMRFLSAQQDERAALEEKIKELEEKLVLVEKDKEQVYNREQNTRAGYVYVISNIGSFGEDVYKIGMTRRLEPIDRVKELGDASVPFTFDVHAMIFSDDAPTLEKTLHDTFQQKSVNKVNYRKEFFNVSLSEIEEVVKRNHNKTVEFTKIAEAKEYRETLQQNKMLEKTVVTSA